jgi:superfamily II DNA helicase RecQ
MQVQSANCVVAAMLQVERRMTMKGEVCLSGTTRVVCATIAFGLGMDLPGVGLIVHWDAATSLQEYVQQIGRGGRCGCKCLCITFYDRAFMKRAMRQAADIRDRTRRQAELVSIQQVRDPHCHAQCSMHETL